MSQLPLIAPFQPGEQDDDIRMIPISALQHAVYCLRQAALIHLEQQWDENRFTAEGHVLHIASDRGDSRQRGEVRRVHALAVGSRRLALQGVCDLVEVRWPTDNEREIGVAGFFPVEFKRGKPKQHRADEVQLCAQALCLEDMTGTSISEGAVYYAQTKRRTVVALDAELRSLTEQTAIELQSVLASGRTPPPTEHRKRCTACSLRELCRPDLVRRGSASDWVEGELAKLLGVERTP